MKIIKNIIREIFIILGMTYYKLHKFELKSDYIFFFPDYNLGGAEKVHADIIYLVKHKNPIIIFYYNSINGVLFQEFKNLGQIIDLGRLNRFNYYIKLGEIINSLRHKNKGIIFGSNNTFYYEIVRRINNLNLKYFDITHNQSFSKLKKDDYTFIGNIFHKRIFIDPKSLQDTKIIYSQLPNNDFVSRTKLINNKVYIPDKLDKIFNDTMKICYAGRGDKEKRLYLWFEIAKRIVEINSNIEFYMIGNCLSINEQNEMKFINYLGIINDRIKLSEIFTKMHLFLLTSESEGFPLSIMESMAFGVIPITTSVGGIPYHIIHNTTGQIISGKTDKEIINNAIKFILLLEHDRNKLEQLSKNVAAYAKLNFSETIFDKEYNNILLRPNNFNS